ncbi:CAP domain-containing protein [Christiangramia aquimixticola]|uniref:CAP domain-containing protein n=1 Tax=Christiangramia aquimixticola TaxID=1697558 RepID=UPI003AA8FF05
MKNFTTTGLILFLCTFFLTSCSKDSINDEVTGYNHVVTTYEVYNYNAIEVEILEDLNIYRKANGLNELQPISAISIESEDHNKYMIQTGTVSHDNFSSRASHLMNQLGAVKVGENVGYGYRTADAVVNAWLKSKGHKENIEGDYTHFGISVRQDAEGKNYFTNMFVKK